MAELYIHVGTHKTGSTAIQTALRLSSARLREAGLVNLPLPASARGFKRTRSVDTSAIASAREELKRSLDETARVDDRLRYVLSWEGFSGDRDRGYANTPVVAECLHELVRGHSPTIIVYLRRQDDLVESIYTQHIKVGGALSFQDYVARFDDESFDWALFLTRYASVFGGDRLRVRRYHRRFLPTPESLLTDFGSLIGCPGLSTGARRATRNPGYSRDALEIARLANQHLDPNAQERLRDVLQRTNAKPPFERFSFFDPEARKVFLQRYDASNAAVARAYFDETVGPLFPSDGDENERPGYEGLTLERAVVILSKALAESGPPATGPRPGAPTRWLERLGHSARSVLAAARQGRRRLKRLSRRLR